MVHTTWCGFCNMLIPKWNKLAEAEKGHNVVIGHVLCDSKDGKKICDEWGITSYPSLLYFEQDSDEMIKYKGDRDVREFI